MDPSATPPPDYSDRSSVVLGVTIWLMTICIGMVGLRLWTRKVLINQIGIDDYLAVVSLFVILGEGVAICTNTRYGLGKHIWMVMPDFVLFMRTFYVSIVLYTAALLFIKLTFLFQYYRLLAVHKMKYVYIAAIVIVGCWSLSQVLVGIFLCHPVEGFWHLEMQQTGAATCIPNYPQFYINAAGNIVTDVAVFVLPLPVIGHLKLAKPQKLLLLGIFSLGFFTVAISIIRIRFLKIYMDTTWENVEPQLWSIGELTSAITCACLPTLRPLVSKYFPKLGTVVRSSRGGHSKSYGSSMNSKRHDLESGRGGTMASTESRDPIYDDKPNHFELQHQDSGVASEDVLGLRSTREGLSQEARPPPANTVKVHDASRAVTDAQTIGLRPTIRTEIESPNSKRAPQRHSSHRAIQVQRDVYQTNSRQ